MAVEESGSGAGQGGLAALTANLSLSQISHSRLKTLLPPALLSYAPQPAYPAHPSPASNLRSPPPPPQPPTLLLL
ncbi:hypothetical protein PanWU01x14_275590 [Parasponia andersonii]|uniref:Uncharacterized protein n=1 Tax=Parasponia andersonii TaxID=3476 RepID=A0A2P5B387_PARAD|nr:hypothetical protein PanWU01x14_275590 [Parasponia andersonii]